ncbi:nucleotide-diphospho-sugar transferase [Larkinella sp. VNQ87]|uniref:nucleotide-diphospho-sugar transferase n=1 Tax=Larkinella sp. VNQ87 TaxID=3400921 RepID=UPI003C0296BE
MTPLPAPQVDVPPPFDVPVLFILFNRPALARRVFERIRQIQPRELFLAIDGPRPNHPTDPERVAQCLALLDEVDWPCQIQLLTQEQNLGCRRAVSTAITWFFRQVEMGIILEDDCLPDPTFFTFCRENLHYHRDNTAIMHIGGVNLHNGRWYGKGSYFYTKICHVWGWASWRRAWANYDVDMTTYPDFKSQKLITDIFTDPQVQQFWTESFDGTFAGLIDTWDFQWCYTIWTHNGLCINPNQNLISNIGFGIDATHTRENNEIFSNRPVQPLNEIVHPRFIIENRQATEYSLQNYFRKLTRLKRRVEEIKKKTGLVNMKTTFKKHLLP